MTFPIRSRLAFIRGACAGERSPVSVLVLCAAMWVALIAGEWGMRFHWFRWHELLTVPSAMDEKGPYESMKTVTNSVVRGGDLTTFLGPVPSADKYKEWKPAATNWTDELGFRNKPPTLGGRFPIITAGDSFMLSGPRMEETFAGRLSIISGLPVYNYAYDGRGPAWSILRFLLTGERFHGPEQKVVVWGILERDVFPGVFSRAMEQVADAEERVRSIAVARMLARELSAERLGKSLPDSSILALISSRAWSSIRHRVLRRESTVVAAGSISGRDVLFYRPGIEALAREWDGEALNAIVESIVLFQQVCAHKGARLLVLLIPDKERIYWEHISGEAFPCGSFVSESVLTNLEQPLRERGVPVVNLLPVFAAEAAKGILLYWTDDTHWNTQGVDIAAKAAWPEVSRLISPQEN